MLRLPRACSACAHAEAGAIAKAIAGSASNLEVARRFGITDSSVQRHRVNCLRSPRRPKKSGRDSSPSESGASLRFDSASGKIASPKDLLERLQSLFRLGDLLEEAIARKDVDAVVKLARELRATAESYAKVAGWLAVDGASSTLIDNRKQTIQVLASISEEDLRAFLAGEKSTLADVTDNEHLTPGSGRA